jgi:hypothetical protein
MFGIAQTRGCRRMKLDAAVGKSGRLRPGTKGASHAADSGNAERILRHLDPTQGVLQELEAKAP